VGLLPILRGGVAQKRRLKKLCLWSKEGFLAFAYNTGQEKKEEDGAWMVHRGSGGAG